MKCIDLALLVIHVTGCSLAVQASLFPTSIISPTMEGFKLDVPRIGEGRLEVVPVRSLASKYDEDKCSEGEIAADCDNSGCTSNITYYFPEYVSCYNKSFGIDSPENHELPKYLKKAEEFQEGRISVEEFAKAACHYYTYGYNANLHCRQNFCNHWLDSHSCTEWASWYEEFINERVFPNLLPGFGKNWTWNCTIDTCACENHSGYNTSESCKSNSVSDSSTTIAILASSLAIFVLVLAFLGFGAIYFRRWKTYRRDLEPLYVYGDSNSQRSTNLTEPLQPSEPTALSPL